MARKIFMTGGSGFVGSRLRERLAESGWPVRCLLRRSSGEDAADDVHGDLLAPETYQDALKDVSVVIHLAALTGKAAPKDYWTANVEGARALLAACKDAGVGHIVYVSSIAAGFADTRFYPYAQSKLAAEELVRESGMAFTILRPTVILGAQSPLWGMLSRIVRLPIIPLPQARAAVRIQPIEVDEVVRAIEIVLTEGRFAGETFDVGGRDPELFADFLQAVRRQTCGISAPVVRIPLRPIRQVLAWVEPALRPLLPVTAGQLSLFANDTVADNNWLMGRLRPKAPDLQDLLGSLTVPPPVAVATPAADEDSADCLEKECAVFSRYLAGEAPTSAVVRHYVAACRRHGLAQTNGLSKFDDVSLKVARKGPVSARAVDAFCALFARSGALRRKMIILAAILENQSPTNEIYEKPLSIGPMRTLFRLAVSGIAFLMALALGSALIGMAKLGGGSSR